jgi:hypothetical protein
MSRLYEWSTFRGLSYEVMVRSLCRELCSRTTGATDRETRGPNLVAGAGKRPGRQGIRAGAEVLREKEKLPGAKVQGGCRR